MSWIYFVLVILVSVILVVCPWHHVLISVILIPIILIVCPWHHFFVPVILVPIILVVCLWHHLLVPVILVEINLRRFDSKVNLLTSFNCTTSCHRLQISSIGIRLVFSWLALMMHKISILRILLSSWRFVIITY